MVSAAITLMDEAGLDSITMRSLAERLQVTPGSLYRHVRDKDELLVLLAVNALVGAVSYLLFPFVWKS